MPLLIIFGVPGAIAAFYIYTQHRERMEAIRRGVHVYRIPSAPRNGNAPLGWGLVLASIGLALALTGFGLWDRVDRDMITGGLLLLFGGGALLTYWRITAGDRRKAYELYEKRLKVYMQEMPKHAHASGADGQAAPESTAQTGEL